LGGKRRNARGGDFVINGKHAGFFDKFIEEEGTEVWGRGAEGSIHGARARGSKEGETEGGGFQNLCLSKWYII